MRGSTSPNNNNNNTARSNIIILDILSPTHPPNYQFLRKFSEVQCRFGDDLPTADLSLERSTMAAAKNGSHYSQYQPPPTPVSSASILPTTNLVVPVRIALQNHGGEEKQRKQSTSQSSQDEVATANRSQLKSNNQIITTNMKLVKRVEIPNESASESPNDTVSSANAEPIPHQKIDLQTIQQSNYNNNKIDNYWDHDPLHGMNHHSSGPQSTKRHQKGTISAGFKIPEQHGYTNKWRVHPPPKDKSTNHPILQFQFQQQQHQQLLGHFPLQGMNRHWPGSKFDYREGCHLIRARPFATHMYSPRTSPFKLGSYRNTTWI